MSWYNKGDWLAGSAIYSVYTFSLLESRSPHSPFSVFSLSLSPFLILAQLSFQKQHAI